MLKPPEVSQLPNKVCQIANRCDYGMPKLNTVGTFFFIENAGPLFHFSRFSADNPKTNKQLQKQHQQIQRPKIQKIWKLNNYKTL